MFVQKVVFSCAQYLKLVLLSGDRPEYPYSIMGESQTDSRTRWGNFCGKYGVLRNAVFVTVWLYSRTNRDKIFDRLRPFPSKHTQRQFFKSVSSHAHSPHSFLSCLVVKKKPCVVTGDCPALCSKSQKLAVFIINL